MTRRVEVQIRHDVRAYLPVLRWDWWDNAEGCLSLTFGNRNCDPLLSIDLIVHRVPRWLGGAEQSIPR